MLVWEGRVWGAPSDALQHRKLSAELADQGTYGGFGMQQEPQLRQPPVSPGPAAWVSSVAPGPGP